MFDRFRDSLVYPRRIIQYRKDKFIRVFGYILVFATLMLSASFVGLLRIDMIARSYSDYYKDNLSNELIDCDITDGDVTCVEEGGYFYSAPLGLIDVDMGVFEEAPNEVFSPLNMVVLFVDDQIIVHYGGMIFSGSYDELPEEFRTMDFKDAKNNPTVFSDHMMEGAGAYLKGKLNIIMPIVLISGLIGNVLLILFVVFMNALILKMRFKVIPFKETFNMGVYLGTTLYILFILNGFFGLGIFMIILFLIVTFRQTNAISYEILRRLKK